MLIIRLISNSFSVEVSFPPLTQLIWNVQNVVKRNVYSLCCKSETKSSARGLFYNQSKHYCKTVFSLSSLDLLLSLIQQCSSFFYRKWIPGLSHIIHFLELEVNQKAKFENKFKIAFNNKIFKVFSLNFNKYFQLL